MQWAGGDVYEGGWRRDRMHGEGTMSYGDGVLHMPCRGAAYALHTHCTDTVEAL